MQSIIPAIIPKSIEDLTSHLDRVGGTVKRVQVDVVDGLFVPFVSWPYTDNASIQELEKISKSHEIEIDLMAFHPEAVALAYVTARVKALVIHLESTDMLSSLLKTLTGSGIDIGLSLLNDTPLDALTPYIEEIDFVQLMGIKDIGTQGQPFDARVLERIASLRAQYEELTISVDGGVNHETALLLKEAGATRLVSGSAIFGTSDPVASYRSLEAVYEVSE